MTEPIVRTVNTAQCVFAYREFGRGPAILLTNGAFTTGIVWTDAAIHLAERGRRVLVPDLPGTGGSGSPREGFGRATLGRAFVLFVKGLGEERISVVGHGIGAFLAIEIAAGSPYVVDHLVLISPVVGGLDGAHRRLTGDEALAESHLYATDGDIVHHTQAVADLFMTFDRAKASYSRSVDRRDARKIDAEIVTEAGRVDDALMLRSLRCPVLLIRGEHDHTVSSERGTAILRACQNGMLSTIPDAGHFVHIEQPEAVAAVVADFVGR